MRLQVVSSLVRNQFGDWFSIAADQEPFMIIPYLLQQCRESACGFVKIDVLHGIFPGSW